MNDRLMMKQLYTAVDCIKAAIGIVDVDGRVIYANKAKANLHGYENGDQMVGLHWRELYDNCDEAYSKVHEIGKWEGELWATRGEEKFLMGVSMNKVDDNGFVCIGQDITVKQNERRSMISKLQDLLLEGL